MTFKQHLTSMLATGHKHEEMTQMLACSYCGAKFKKAEALFNRIKKEHPEEFIRPIPQYQESQKTLAMQAQLEERIKHDSAYRKHLDILTHGTDVEKAKEWRKEDNFAK